MCLIQCWYFQFNKSIFLKRSVIHDPAYTVFFWSLDEVVLADSLVLVANDKNKVHISVRY